MIKRVLTTSASLLAITLAGAPASAVAESRPGGDAAALAEAETLLAPGPGATPASAVGSSAQPPQAEATQALRRLGEVYPELNRPERRRARRILARPAQRGDPDYFGREAASSPRCNDAFCIHWSQSPKSAPNQRDLDRDGTPDFAEEVLGAAAQAERVENDELGWQRARSDARRGSRGGRGADGQVDIYLTNLKKVFGYATTDFSTRGRSRPAFLVLDNDYRGFGSNPLELMRATMAHEYNHVLQFGYDTTAENWMFESTATWMEERVFPEVDDYLGFVADFARDPVTPMAPAARKPSNKDYGSAVWHHWLASRYDPDLIRSSWERSADFKPRTPATEAIESALAAAGGRSMAEEFFDFAVATAEWRGDRRFPDSTRYRSMRRHKLGKGARNGRITLDHTAYGLLDVPATPGARALEVAVRAKDGISGGFAIVARRGPKIGGETIVEDAYLKRGGRASLRLEDPAQYDRITLMAINADVSLAGTRYAADGARFRFKLRAVR